MTQNNFRHDVNGLRSIAVISVLFYHAGLEIFNFNFLTGGLLGVDIIFVISGFFALPDLIAFFSGDPTAPLPVIILGLITLGLFYYGSKKGTI